MSSRAAWAGWVMFAGVMLLVTGAINVVEGIAALVWDQEMAVVQDKLYVVDLTGWGWALLIFGAAMVAVGSGLLLAQTWARVLGILVVALHAVVQVVWIGAYPVWSLLMIGLDTVVLFALTARWSEARDAIGLDDGEAPVRGRPTPAAGQTPTV